MSDEIRELAGRFFDENEAAAHRRSGMPEDGVAHLRQHYVEGVAGSPEAQQGLRDHYSGKRPLKPWGERDE